MTKDFLAWILHEAAEGLWSKIKSLLGHEFEPEYEHELQYPPTFPFGNPFSDIDGLAKDFD